MGSPKVQKQSQLDQMSQFDSEISRTKDSSTNQRLKSKNKCQNDYNGAAVNQSISSNQPMTKKVAKSKDLVKNLGKRSQMKSLSMITAEISGGVEDKSIEELLRLREELNNAIDEQLTVVMEQKKIEENSISSSTVITGSFKSSKIRQKRRPETVYKLPTASRFDNRSTLKRSPQKSTADKAVSQSKEKQLSKSGQKQRESKVRSVVNRFKEGQKNIQRIDNGAGDGFEQNSVKQMLKDKKKTVSIDQSVTGQQRIRQKITDLDQEQSNIKRAIKSVQKSKVQAQNNFAAKRKVMQKDNYIGQLNDKQKLEGKIKNGSRVSPKKGGLSALDSNFDNQSLFDLQSQYSLAHGPISHSLKQSPIHPQTRHRLCGQTSESQMMRRSPSQPKQIKKIKGIASIASISKKQQTDVTQQSQSSKRGDKNDSQFNFLKNSKLSKAKSSDQKGMGIRPQRRIKIDLSKEQSGDQKRISPKKASPKKASPKKVFDPDKMFNPAYDEITPTQTDSKKVADNESKKSVVRKSRKMRQQQRQQSESQVNSSIDYAQNDTLNIEINNINNLDMDPRFQSDDKIEPQSEERILQPIEQDIQIIQRKEEESRCQTGEQKVIKYQNVLPRDDLVMQQEPQIKNDVQVLSCEPGINIEAEKIDDKDAELNKAAAEDQFERQVPEFQSDDDARDQNLDQPQFQYDEVIEKQECEAPREFPRDVLIESQEPQFQIFYEIDQQETLFKTDEQQVMANAEMEIKSDEKNDKKDSEFIGEDKIDQQTPEPQIEDQNHQHSQPKFQSSEKLVEQESELQPDVNIEQKEESEGQQQPDEANREQQEEYDFQKTVGHNWNKVYKFQSEADIDGPQQVVTQAQPEAIPDQQAVIEPSLDHNLADKQESADPNLDHNLAGKQESADCKYDDEINQQDFFEYQIEDNGKNQEGEPTQLPVYGQIPDELAEQKINDQNIQQLEPDFRKIIEELEKEQSEKQSDEGQFDSNKVVKDKTNCKQLEEESEDGEQEEQCVNIELNVETEMEQQSDDQNQKEQSEEDPIILQHNNIEHVVAPFTNPYTFNNTQTYKQQQQEQSSEKNQNDEENVPQDDQISFQQQFNEDMAGKDNTNQQQISESHGIVGFDGAEASFRESFDMFALDNEAESKDQPRMLEQSHQDSNNDEKDSVQVSFDYFPNNNQVCQTLPVSQGKLTTSNPTSIGDFSPLPLSKGELSPIQISSNIDLSTIQEPRDESVERKNIMTEQSINKEKTASVHSDSDFNRSFQYSGSQNSSMSRYMKDQFLDYVNIDNEFGMSQSDYAYFGDRAPSGFKKVRLLSKLQHQVYWLFEVEQAEEDESEEDGDEVPRHYIVQQVPRQIPSFNQKMKSINVAENELYQKLMMQQGIRNLIFEIDQIIETDEDTWVVFDSERDLDQYMSLQQALWQVTFDPKKMMKSYKITHGTFFKLLAQKDGKKSLSKLVDSVCELLKCISAIGAIYANLRTENIMIKLNAAKDKIEEIKFMNFGYMVEIESSEAMCIPDQVEHLPPDMLQHLLQIKRFKYGQQDDYTRQSIKFDMSVNVKFLQSCATADIFALGTILLQIATGCPSQLELPVQFRCRTVKNKFFVGASLFGHCQDSVITEKHVGHTIKLQDRLLKNIDVFLKKKFDHSGLLKDKKFYEIMTKMTSPNYFMRPNIKEIASSCLLVKP